MAGTAGRIARVFLWGGAVTVIGGISGFLGVLGVVYWMVYFGDDTNLSRASVLARINEETNIYMLDGETQIGSIFDTSHRSYVRIDDVPAHMINALVAAEDKNFYDHGGIDPGAIVAAAVGYFKTGRMRGASTLTQQTVRNIMGWWEVSLSRKFREWIAALQLERIYSKREILEFYLNQFYVSGNGNGIGIAAKYYFNKDVRDLNLVESAFIAGSVKGPSAYDPFIKFTKEKRERAIRNAYHRKNYVLKRMYEQGWIETEEQFKEAWDAPVKFSRGKFRSDEVTLVHVVRQQMARKEILEALHIEDPRELAAAGLKIFTTIDPEMQRGGQLAMRRNLSRLETILKGYQEEKPEFFRNLRNLTVNEFYFGRVLEIGGTAKEPELKLTFGLPTCTIPYESLMRYAKQVDLPFARGWQKELDTMLKKIQPGHMLYTEIKEYNPETHEGVCEMMKRPRINGGMIALDKGEVRAVVSGFDTQGFNRAISARRQPGSVFKPVVYFAALHLGWSVLDRLDNERQVFPYQGRFYYPRPDHDSPYRDTSMLWAGIMSENLASIALTARLVEKLNFDQFRQLMGFLELLPKGGEAPRDFHYRVARSTGVQLDNDGVREFQLNNAIADLLLDVQYTTTIEFQQRLKKMWMGRGYLPEMQAILLADDDLSPKQKAQKLQMAANNLTRYTALDSQMVADWNAIAAAVAEKGAEEAFLDPGIQKLLTRFRVLPGISKPALGYAAVLDGERPQKAWKNRDEIEAFVAPAGRMLNALDMQAVWSGSAMFGSADITVNEVLVDGWLAHSHIEALKQYVEQHFNDVMSRSEEYDLYRYYQHHDFRIAVGLNYLVNLAKAMGITSPVEPVLSFPLGTNVVTVAEVAKAYQTLISGKTYRFYDEGPPNQVNFIRRIEDRWGNLVFEPKIREHQLAAPEFAFQMREILQRVITHGTGRRARAELYLTLNPANSDDPAKLKAEKRVRIPSFGKTGTTNDYTNSNFAGFIPYPVEKGAPLDPANSYTLAAYVGYDLNKTMQNGFIKVSGAQGALPAWIGLGKEIIEKKKYVEMLDALDLNLIARQEWPMETVKGVTPVVVDMPRGVLMNRGGGADQESVEMSNIDREGESSFDEFRANVVQATVRLPLDGSGAPVRMMHLFRHEEGAGSAVSRIEVKPEPGAPPPAVITDVSQSGGTAPGNTGKPATRYDSGASGAAAGTPAGSKSRPATTGGKSTSADQDNAGGEAGGEDAGADNGGGGNNAVDLDGAPDSAPEGGVGATGGQAGGADGAGAPGEDKQVMDLFRDIGDPDKDLEPAPAAPDDDDAGFVEEEIW